MDKKPSQPLDNPISLLSRAFFIYWHKLSTLLPLSFIVFIVGLLQIFSVQAHSAVLSIVSALAGVLVAYVVYLAIIRAISSPVSMHVGEVFVNVERYIVPGAWVSGLLILVVLGGSLFAIIPGIIVAVYLMFSIYALVIDHYEKREALTFSWHLVEDRWLNVVLRFVVANIAIELVVSVIMSIFWMLGLGETPFQTVLRAERGLSQIPVGQLILSQAVSNFFTMPIVLCFTYVFYEELKKTRNRNFEREERKDINWYIRTLAIIGAALLVVSIFISTFIIARILPEIVQATHMPAAVFSVF